MLISPSFHRWFQDSVVLMKSEAGTIQSRSCWSFWQATRTALEPNIIQQNRSEGVANADHPTLPQVKAKVSGPAAWHVVEQAHLRRRWRGHLAGEPIGSRPSVASGGLLRPLMRKTKQQVSLMGLMGVSINVLPNNEWFTMENPL